MSARSRWPAEVATRLLTFLFTVVGVALLVQVMLWAAPGDPIDLLPNSEELRPQLTVDWHLDEPLPARFAHYVLGALSGDLGTSLTYRPGMPVLQVVAGPALRSLLWLSAALCLTMIWGTALAWTSSGTTATRRLIQAVSIAPAFLLAIVLVSTLNDALWWGIEADWIARPDWFALPGKDSPVRTALAVLVLAVGSGALSDVTAEVENALVRIRGSGYVDAARARNEPTWPHVAANLVAPLTTIATTRLAFFVGELVILERVFLLNGVGSILWQAAIYRDYELAMGIAMLCGFTVALVRLLGDALRMFVDPRLRQSAG